MMKRLKKILYFIFSKKKVRQFLNLGFGRFIQFNFFQRILRVNGNVPWPVHWSSLILHHEKIRISGDLVFPGIQPGCYINAKNGIEIANNVRIGPGVKLISANHDVDDFDIAVKAEPIVISNNCWIGANVVILPEVRLGDHCVVAAGAVVRGTFEGNCIIAGVPARIVKKLGDYRGNSEWGIEKTLPV